MRKAVLELSGVLLSAVIAACAQAPVDDDPGGATQATNKTEPSDNSAKLPPSNPSQTSSDAGAKDSGSTTKDSGTTTQKDSGSSNPPPDAGSTGTGGSCDPNDTMYLLEALDELNKSSPRTCGISGGSCKSTECCFDIYGVCVDL